MVKAAEKNYDAKALEARVAAFWKATDAYEETRKSRATGQPWYFLDGPPYATGHIHIGTARNKILKDTMIRHMRQRGFNVRDQPGYDMHGLPIEVKVEKELGMTTKKDIESYGIDRFVEACRTFAVDHLKMMNEEFKELGVWMDWDNPYMTIKNEYVEGAWWAIAKAHERGLLFENERVLSWCWRCETALANAEIEFEDRADPSAYVKFPVKTDAATATPEYFVIWTTTPWTLPANVAIAVNPKVPYARVRVTKDGRQEILYIAADVAASVSKAGRYDHFEILTIMPGEQLEGMHYTHPFQEEVKYHATPASAWNNRIILGDHVAADRTGLVHTATGHGVEDFEAGKRYGIPVFSPVGENGRFTDVAGIFQGLAVKGGERSEADTAVLAHLDAKGLLMSAKDEKHSYGHCWRCKNPIIYRATNQWFIAVPKIKDRMVEEVKRVEWTPEWAGSARQLDWVENARDWCISRQRYWGIPLPVWKCTAAGCNEVHVIASRKELSQVSDFRGESDLHRPWIDKVRVACHRNGCGGVMKRVPDVLDVWFDSAVASWASLGYPSDKAAHDKWFPAAWICEGLDQTRGWFYSQLGAGVAAMDRVPYERVVMHGWVHDANGRPMSKSLGNIVQPHDVIEQFGADALRLGIVSGAAPWEDISFGTDTVRAAQRTFNILWNVHVFATGYMADDKFEPGPMDDLHDDMRPEDRWLVSRLQTTVAETTRFIESAEFHRAAREIERFVLDDLSRWYVRLVRERVWNETPSEDKRHAYLVLHESLFTIARLLAPFAPFLAEALYQDLTDGKRKLSVHMEDWPVADGGLTDYDLEHDMANVRAAVDAAAYARQKANMKLRWPVAKLTFATDSADVRSALMRFEALVLEQANTKSIEIVSGEWEHLHLQPVPTKSIIGKTYRQDGPAIIKGLLGLDQATLRGLRQRFQQGDGGNVDIAGVTIHATPEILAFETRLPENMSGADFTGGSVYVETDVTPQLQAEGSARDLTRRIQEMRKLLALPMNASIATTVVAPEEFQALVTSHVDAVATDTRSAHIAFVDKAEGELVRDWDLEGTTLTIGVARAESASFTPSAPAAAATEAAPAAAPAKPAAKAEKATPPAEPAPVGTYVTAPTDTPAESKATEAARQARAVLQTRLDSNEPAAPATALPKKTAKKKVAKKAAKKPAPKKAAAMPAPEAPVVSPPPTPAKPVKAAAKAAAKKAAAKPAKKAAAKTAAAKPVKTSAAKKTAAKKSAAKTPAAPKATPKKAAAKKAPAKKSAAPKAAAAKSAAKPAPAKKAATKKAAGKKAATKKAAGEKASKK